MAANELFQWEEVKEPGDMRLQLGVNGGKDIVSKGER